MTQSRLDIGLILLWILDTNAALDFKRYDLVPLDQQWEFWDYLLGIVREGNLIFPAQVRKELADPSKIKHPDMPSGWAAQAWKEMEHRHPLGDEDVKEIIDRYPNLIDPKKEKDEADPYVVALALDLDRKRAGYEVCVVLADEGDKALRAACEGFGIPVVGASEFVARIFPQARA